MTPDPLSPRPGDRWLSSGWVLIVVAVDPRGPGRALVRLGYGLVWMQLADLVRGVVDAIADGYLWAAGEEWAA